MPIAIRKDTLRKHSLSSTSRVAKRTGLLSLVSFPFQGTRQECFLEGLDPGMILPKGVFTLHALLSFPWYS